MNILNPIENAFSDPAIPSFEYVRDQIASNYEIPHPSRMDMVSAINKIEKWCGMPLSINPASTEFLRHKFKGFHHAQVGASARRVRNIRSLLLRAIRTVGLTTKLSPLSDERQMLFDVLPGRLGPNQYVIDGSAKIC